MIALRLVLHSLSIGVTRSSITRASRHAIVTEDRDSVDSTNSYIWWFGGRAKRCTESHFFAGPLRGVTYLERVRRDSRGVRAPAIGTWGICIIVYTRSKPDVRRRVEDRDIAILLLPCRVSCSPEQWGGDSPAIPPPYPPCSLVMAG